MLERYYVEAIDNRKEPTGIVYDYRTNSWMNKPAHPGYPMIEGAVAVAQEVGFAIGIDVKITQKT